MIMNPLKKRTDSEIFHEDILADKKEAEIKKQKIQEIKKKIAEIIEAKNPTPQDIANFNLVIKFFEDDRYQSSWVKNQNQPVAYFVKYAFLRIKP